MKTILVFLILCGALISCYAGDDIKGKVTGVIDGNTIEVSAPDGEVYKVMLKGIDSPEPGQNYSDQAKKFLEKLLINKSVTLTLGGKDRWGNRLGEITMDGANDPRRELVREGLAWTSEKEPIQELELLKEEARAKGLGLWQEPDPTPPWTYRRQQTMTQTKSS